MHIRHLAVQNFRGIKNLDWHLDGRVICLVGPGDSTKTTILDAIECALIPRYYLPFTNTDFYIGKLDEPITIEVTIGEIPKELLADDKYGSYLRGYRSGEAIVDDPEDDCEPVLTIQLRVGKDLEPAWAVIKQSNPEQKPISWRDREKLGLTRLGNDVDRHLTWGRGSALARITTKETTSGQTFADINRAAQEIVNNAALDELRNAAQRAQEAATDHGVRSGSFRPGLDAQSVSLGFGALSLHDEAIPMRSAGLGTRRLTALAVQQIGLGSEAAILIDEVEHGLEPHRIRKLLKKVCVSRIKNVEGAAENTSEAGQVIMTTHSPTPIMSLSVGQLRFAQSEAGTTTVRKVAALSADKVQSIVRKRGHVLLARKILVCEGKTEEALCRELDDFWTSRNAGKSMALLGAVPVDGEGRNNGPTSAAEFKRLGYDVMYFGDSDEPIDPSADELISKEIAVAQWADAMATEQRISMDLPWGDLQNLVDEAMQLRGGKSILRVVGDVLKCDLVEKGAKIDDWISTNIDEDAVRSAIGLAAKLEGWFKDLNAGEKLGRVVVKALPSIPTSDLATKLKQIESWLYA